MADSTGFDPKIGTANLNQLAKEAGYVRLPPLFVRGDDMPHIHELARQYLDDINRLRVLQRERCAAYAAKAAEQRKAAEDVTVELEPEFEETRKGYPAKKRSKKKA